jgi:hypothetical protein
MKKRNLLSVAVFLWAAVAPSALNARTNEALELNKKGPGGPHGILVLDGSNVHNVGELQMHMGNWGYFGSAPGSANTFSEAPSAQWPAGSGVEYLYVAGLWVGALKSGVPAVTTAAYAAEYRPTQDVRDIIYRSSEGDRGGNRRPSTTADDDTDGVIDEDWLNGYDDDADGQIDEDFAAVSKQMFVCQYIDNGPSSIQIYPQHNPLNLHVRQESYQWEEDRFDDFVGAQFYITNIGMDALQDLYVGFFADGDAGPRTTENYWEDDATGFLGRELRCTDLGPVLMDIAYVYDVDGDEGKTAGFLGMMFLGHTTDPAGEFAPTTVGVTTYASFAGSASYENGGDPTNDFERYELLSSEVRDRNATIPRDYRLMMAAGPFAELLPGSTIVFQAAFVVGLGLDGMVTNAANAQFTFEGAWFDLDFDTDTGSFGRETLVRGPAEGILVDSCLYENQGPRTVPAGQSVWINNDCGEEELFALLCGYSDGDSAKFKTGIGGAETQLFWIVGTAPPPPALRIDPAAKDGVAVYWDNFSETVPDVKTQVQDFEGYRVFRADNWNRPIGTSAENGPPADLWKLLFQADIVNGFGEDTGLSRYRYEPLTKLLPESVKRDMITALKQQMTEFPGQDPPCPQGVTQEVCDTLTALAAWELGVAGGRQYYRYIDRAIHRGRPYFYAVSAGDHAIQGTTLSEGKIGDPQSNFVFVEPQSPSQADYEYNEDAVYVVPNPATTESMQPWTLSPNNDDPTGIKVEFRNLPAAGGTIRIFTLAGDLVEELPFDGRSGNGTMEWDLVSRNGQDVTSGVYIFAVETDTNDAYKRKIGKFVVIR